MWSCTRHVYSRRNDCLLVVWHEPHDYFSTYKVPHNLRERLFRIKVPELPRYRSERSLKGLRAKALFNNNE